MKRKLMVGTLIDYLISIEITLVVVLSTQKIG